MAQAIPQAEPGIDLKSLLDKLEFTPHSPGQKEYVYSKARFNVPCCGRRWGKSQATGHRGTYKLFVPDSYNWIVGPNYKLGEKEFRVIWNDLNKLGLLKHCKKTYQPRQGDMSIRTPWGSVLEVVSAENQDSLLGEGLSHAIMAEAAQHDRSTWEQYIEPALSDLLGTADFPSTPKGYNWYHGLWLLGQPFSNPIATDLAHQPNPGSVHLLNPNTPQLYKSWSFPTWTNTVRYPGGLDDPEIQRIKAVVSKHWFDQEYGASFTAIAGTIYGDEWNEQVHVQACPFNPKLGNYLAFDYGYVNPFCALDIQIGADESVYVWREYYKSYMSTVEHAQALRDREQPTDYHVDGMWGDPRGADEAATIATVLGFVAGPDVRWKLAVEEIKRLLKCRPPKLYIDPSCTNLIRQMGSLHVKPLSRQTKTDLNEHTGGVDGGNIQHKVDDHAVDALRYFIGPYFVLGAGSRMEDVYNTPYHGSEAQDFFTTVTDGAFTLESELTLGKQF